MPFVKGNPGKPKGARNLINRDVESIAARLNVKPFEVLCHFAAGDCGALGLTPGQITPGMRLHAAREASKYLYSQKRAVEVSSGEQGFKIVVEDFTAKK